MARTKVTPVTHPHWFRLATRSDIDNLDIHEFYTSNGDRWRRNGKVQTWKRDPNRFRLPVKYGLKDYDEITQWDLGEEKNNVFVFIGP
jgi:hypothetical protein